MVDMAHFAGLVAGGVHPNPLDHAHVVTTTTHKTLRGPRGGMILSRDADLGKKINSAVFPGLQGGPLMHVIAAKAVAFGEALKPGIQALCEGRGGQCQGAGRDAARPGPRHRLGRHRHASDAGRSAPQEGTTGRAAEKALDRAFITCNKNAVPFDTEKPAITSGIRLGSPAGTTRGFGAAEFREIGKLIVEVVDALGKKGEAGDPDVEASVRERVASCANVFPIYR